MSNFKLRNIETGGATGMDALFANEPQIISPVGESKPSPAPRRIKVASLSGLKGFTRVASDTLVNKATNDLWALREEDGAFFIERLFQDDGQPLKG
jgi:hypothetical protein